jgi:hypothetical protein
MIFGKGITSAKSGSPDSLVLAVDDINAARNDLIRRGVNVSEVFHYAGGPFNNAVENARVGGRDPQGRSYFSFASFEDTGHFALETHVEKIAGAMRKFLQKLPDNTN